MTDQPLQEAIAKLEAIRDEHRIDQEWCRCCSQEYPCSTSENAVAALDLLGVLCADDDTRYVAITKQQRDYLMRHPATDTDLAIVKAYDAVAPNAKEDDHA